MIRNQAVGLVNSASSITRPREWRWLMAAIGLASLGVLLILFHTRNGPGVTGDSVHYVMGAENLLAGRGYARTAGGGEAVPITGFPPGYSGVMAGVGLFVVDLFQGGRILNSILFGATVFVVGLLIFRYTRSVVASLIGSALILLSEDLIHVYSWVMSEGLFIVLMLLAVLTLVPFLEKGGLGKLVLAAAILAIATLTRFVGLALVGAAALAAVLFRRDKMDRRIRDAVILGVVGILPLLLWLGGMPSEGGNFANRALAFHPMSGDLVVTLLGTANAWFFPLQLGVSRYLRGSLSLAFTLLVSLLFVIKARGGIRKPQRSAPDFWPLPWLLLIFAPIYLIALAVNTTFLDASTTPSGAARYLSPLFVIGVVSLVSMIFHLTRETRGNYVRYAIPLVAAAFIIATYALRAYAFVSNPGSAFRYTDVKREMPEVVAVLEDIGASRILFSNDIEMVYAIAGTPAYALPIKFDHYVQEERSDFQEQVEFTRGKLKDGAVVVFFGSPGEVESEVLDLLNVIPTKWYPRATFYVLSGTDRTGSLAPQLSAGAYTRAGFWQRLGYQRFAGDGEIT